MRNILINSLISSFIVLCSCSKLDLVAGFDNGKLTRVIDGDLSLSNFSSIVKLRVDDDGNLYTLEGLGSKSESEYKTYVIRQIKKGSISILYEANQIEGLNVMDNYIYFYMGSGINRIKAEKNSNLELVIGYEKNILDIENFNKNKLYRYPYINNDNLKNLLISNGSEIIKISIQNKSFEKLKIGKFYSLDENDLQVLDKSMNLIIDKYTNKIYINNYKQPIYQTNKLYSNQIIEVDLEKGLIDRTPEIEKLINSEINGAIRIFTFDKLGNLYLTTTTKDESTSFFKIDTNKKVTKLAQENVQIYNLSVDTKNQILYMSSESKILKLSLKEKN